MVIRIMDNAEGAAWRMQLEAMVAVLEPKLDDMEDARDNLALTLYDQLTAALTTARQLEDRPTGKQRKGVRLAKR